MTHVIYLIAAYLIGSIPSAYLAGKWLRGIDIREHGSRNVGATNAFRVLGKSIGIAVLIADILKGFLAVSLAFWLNLPPLLAAAGGLCSIMGHNWTVFLKFRGGKGVATSAGVFCALVPWALGAAVLVFALAVVFTRYISVGSILAAFVLALMTTLEFIFSFGDHPETITLILVYVAAVFVIIRHKANIQRLWRGTENRFTLKKKASAPEE